MMKKFNFSLTVLMLTPAMWALNTNVTAYGAKGNGVADDTAALVRASTAVAASGGELYFPAGTYMLNPHEGHIVLGSNMTLYGPGIIRIMPRIGNFGYVMAPSPLWKAISNVTISGITVDENRLNNPSTITEASTQTQDILLGNMLTNLTVKNAKFYLSGLYAFKISNGLNISGSTIIFQAPAGTAWFDNSAIYIPSDSTRCSITNNTFQGQGSIANTAIEVHNTTNCTISGNKFDNYRIAVLPLDAQSLSITGNTITRAEYAISLWAQSLTENVTVNNNTISLNNHDRKSSAATGIALYWCSFCKPVGDFYNIQIRNNRVTFQPDVRTNLDPSAFWGIGIMPAGNVNTVYITGNTITNAVIRGITIGNSQVRGQTTYNVMVANNTIISPGNDTLEPWYLAGIALQGKLDMVTVTDNTITNSGTFTGKYGVWVDPAGSYTSVSVSGNNIGSRYANALVSSIKR